MIEVKYKIAGTEKATPVASPELNQQSWHDKLQTLQSQGKKCKNPHTRVGKTTEVNLRVGGSVFAPTFACLYFRLFFSTRRLL